MTSLQERWHQINLHCEQHDIIQNLGVILEAAGTSLENTVKVNVFLSDMNDFAAMNEVYMQYWGGVKPCRT